MKTVKRSHKKIFAGLLALLLAAGAIPAGPFSGAEFMSQTGPFAPMRAFADGGPSGDVIFNEPYAAPQPYAGADSLDWLVTDHPGYDGRAYTQAESLLRNGVETPDHVVLNGDDISFYGYDVPAYADSAYTDLYEITGASFVLRPITMNFHTFSEAGFLFNGEFYYSANKLFYTGYAVILKCGNEAGMLENNPYAANTASLCLYYIEGEEWSHDSFRPGNVATTRTLVSVMKTGINNLDPTPYRVDIDIAGASRAFDVYIDGALRAAVPASDVKGGASGPAGFGFYTGYYGHSCHILTRIRFEDIKLTVDQTERATSATVRFTDALSGKEIRTPEVMGNGLSGQKYRIAQPGFIDAGAPGFTYVLSGNSRGAETDKDIKLTYRRDPSGNVTTLYYTLRAEGDIGEYTEKRARVNGGDWDNGDPDDPVLVTFGDVIEYNINVFKQAGETHPGGFGEIRDTIADNLTIDEAGITGVKSAAPVAGVITWRLEDGGRTVVWSIPDELYPAGVSVKVKVENWPQKGNLFENAAAVSIGVGSVYTNYTYHEFTYYKITEQYYWFDGETGLPTADKMPYPDLVTLSRGYEPYTVKGLGAGAAAYVFKGYELNGWSGFQPADSVSDIDFYGDEESGSVIKLYYMPVRVTVHFSDEKGNPINVPSSVTETVRPFADYYIKNSYYGSFAYGGKTWNYYGYKLAKPGDGAHMIPGASPVYPGAGPAFAGGDMGANKHITLYFTDRQAVKVYFKELNNPQNILHNTAVFFTEGAFNAAKATRATSGNALFDDIDLTGAFGKIYKYASVYAIDGGAAQTGQPGVCGSPCEITLFFRTSYIIVEKYHKSGPAGADGLTLQPDVSGAVYGGAPFNGAPPASIIKGTEKWDYIGYRTDNDSNPLNPGVPSVSGVTCDITVIYVYVRDEAYTGGGDDGDNGGSGTKTVTGSGATTGSGGKTNPDPNSGKSDAPAIEIRDGGAPLSPFITDHAAYIIGYPEGDVRPENNITRAEVATVFFRLLTDEFREKYWTRNNPYGDAVYSDWHNTAVSVMDNMAIIKGYPDGGFKPDGDITRAELATVAARFAKIMKMEGGNNAAFSDTGGHWAEADILYAARIGWVNGYPDGTYKPDQPITRAEFMTTANRVLKRIPESEDDLLSAGMTRWPDNSPDAWYYLAVQEATNSHEYGYKNKSVPGLDCQYEYWEKMAPNRDWLKLETIWRETYE